MPIPIQPHIWVAARDEAVTIYLGMLSNALGTLNMRAISNAAGPVNISVQNENYADGDGVWFASAEQVRSWQNSTLQCAIFVQPVIANGDTGLKNIDTQLAVTQANAVVRATDTKFPPTTLNAKPGGRFSALEFGPFPVGAITVLSFDIFFV